MKKLILIFLGTIFFKITIAVTVTSVVSGIWNDTTTWDSGIPSSGDNVVIANGDTVSVGSAQSCKNITINAGGILDLKLNSDLSTSATVTNDGTLTMENGSFTVGDGSSDYFKIPGGTLNFSGGVINVAGRYKQYSGGNAYLSGSVIMNISTSGEQSAATINGFYVSGTGEFSVSSGSTAQIILKYGNSGSASEIYYSPAISNFNGGVFVVENTSGLSDIFIDGDMPIYEIESKIGSGKTFHFASGCDFTLTNFTITSGTVQADADAKVKITGIATLGADNNLTLATDASVIFSTTPTEKIIVQRTLSQNAWHYISCPVNDIRNFSTILGSALVSGDYFYRFDEASADDGTWIQIFPTGGSGAMTEAFNIGQGYSIEFNSAQVTISYDGTIRTGNVTYTLTKTGSSSNNGYNLIGNPYQSTIIANNDASGNSLLDVNSSILDTTNNAIYLWDQSITDYQAINNVNTKKRIAVGQGFMVRAKNGGVSFAFHTNMQENGTNTFYKSTAVDNWVRTSFALRNQAGLFNEILIGFSENMTNGLDISYDAGKLKGNPNIALYTYLVDGSQPNISFATQALPSFLSKPVSVNVGFDITEIGEYTFSLKNFEYTSDSTEFEKATIELEDTYTKTIVDLKKHDYIFNTNKSGTIDDRFILHFNQNLLAVKDYSASKSDFLVYSKQENSIVIKNVAYNTSNFLNVRIIDITGRILYEKKLNLAVDETFIIRSISGKGFVLVNIFNKNYNMSYKITLN